MMKIARERATSRRKHETAVMSFQEIGDALGITRGGAWMSYKSAMRKLKKKRRAFSELLQLWQMKGKYL